MTITDDMVERAARELFRFYRLPWSQGNNLKALVDINWTLYAPEAHAALTAALQGQVVAQAERERCIAICESWIGAFQDKDIQYTSAREYAIGAIEDVIDLIRDGHDPSVTRHDGVTATDGTA